MNKQEFDKIMNWCYKNNTIALQEKYDVEKLKKEFGEIRGQTMYDNFSKMAICTKDGGWINLLSLQRFLEDLLK